MLHGCILLFIAYFNFNIYWSCPILCWIQDIRYTLAFVWHFSSIATAERWKTRRIYLPQFFLLALSLSVSCQCKKNWKNISKCRGIASWKGLFFPFFSWSYLLLSIYVDIYAHLGIFTIKDIIIYVYDCRSMWHLWPRWYMFASIRNKVCMCLHSWFPWGQVWYP